MINREYTIAELKLAQSIDFLLQREYEKDQIEESESQAPKYLSMRNWLIKHGLLMQP